MIEAGIKPIIFERGKPVELRGKSIGALFNRKILDPESNLCYGEGGAGTWSDGKLTTRIGKNSEEVRSVLSSLVQHGAPERILVDGKPHLGTDRLVRILKALREYLCSRGAVFAFDTKIVDLIVDRGAGGAPSVVRGVIDSTGRKYTADKVILSVGHSARQLYEKLLFYGVQVEPKPFAAGFRIEHPQELINKIQFGSFGLLCEQGNGPVPVADYRLVAETTTASGGPRSCYSFCMCPGGQIGKFKFPVTL